MNSQKSVNLSLLCLSRAARCCEHGRLYMELAQLYLARNEWGKAIECAQRAQAKGGLDSPCEADYLLGRAYQCIGAQQQAREAWGRIEACRRACRCQVREKLSVFHQDREEKPARKLA